jgi:xylan 1,4-beta-xylosidase
VSLIKKVGQPGSSRTELMRNSNIIILGLVLTLLAASPRAEAQPEPASETIRVDVGAPHHPFPHFWEQTFGSGRAILSLRDDYRDDLRSVKGITGFTYVRFHAILDDDVGIYDEDSQGRAIYNFSYVDQIYDGLLANGVRPYVEISFMPSKLAASDSRQAFWYHPNVSPPKDWSRWDQLMAAFVEHLIHRYGINEVSQWYFEVWNEPNLDFWAGKPAQETYWELYDHTALAIKKISPRLRVGGPATAQAAWVDAMIRHCAEKHIPLDFVSTHVYANDTAEDVFHAEENIPRDQMVCRAVRKVHDEIKASAMPSIPLIWSEFNASYKNETDVTDSIYMGPWLASTISQCDGLVDSMSYWTFSDVFEEQGVVKTPFYGGFGLLAEDGIPKPSFNAFKLLHRLGDERISLASDSALLTSRNDGTLVLALWNYAAPAENGSPKTFTLQVKGANTPHAFISRVDHDHGDFRSAYEKMGNPRYPTQQQIQQLRQSTDLPPPEDRPIQNGQITITIPAHGLALIELK